MRVTTQMGKWGQRIVTVGLVGFAVVVFGAIILQEVVGADVEAMLEPIVAAIDLTGRQALFLFMGAAFALGGAGTVLRQGWPALSRGVTLARHDPVPVGDLHLEEGTVEVTGTAEPMEDVGTITSPYSGTECLGVRYETKELERHSGPDDDRDWKTIERGEHAEPFTVTDESGSVVVDPEGAALSFDRDIVSSSGRRKRYEWRLEPGESVYVSGRKRDGTSDEDGPGGASTYIGDGAETSFTVSDAGETRTILRFLAKGTIYSVVGLILSGAGVMLLYYSGIF